MPRAKLPIVPRKSPNRIKIPYNSMQNPISGHRNKISSRPRKNAAVPLAFCFRAKKRRVLWGPMMMVRPMRKRIWIRQSFLGGGNGSPQGRVDS